jgi:carbonic anhydrase
MKKTLLLASLAFSLLSAENLSHELKNHTSHWGYTGHTAPQYWGELDEKFRMCGIGKSQSPINITDTISVKTQDLNPIHFDYHAQAVNVVNNGHAIQVNVDDYSSINIDGKHFVLKQFHFHSPSENEIQGRSFPLEAHFVHVSKEGDIAVIAVLFELGKENEALQKIFDTMPQHVNQKAELALSAKIIDTLLPKEKEYYYFSGSLTTPPCSEGVKWMVLKKYQTLSKEQLKQFTAVMKGNNRPVQAINARKVIK